MLGNIIFAICLMAIGLFFGSLFIAAIVIALPYLLAATALLVVFLILSYLWRLITGDRG